MAQLKMLWYPENPRGYKDAAPGFTVTPMKADMIEGWCEANIALTEKKWSNQQFVENMLFAPPLPLSPRHIFCAVEDATGRVVATAAACMDGASKRGNLHMVSSVEDIRGKGVGRAVCDAAVRCFVDNGIAEADLSTDDFRIPAIKIYLALGFRPYLYETDMPDRWRAIKKTLGLEHLDAYDVEKQPLTL